MVRAGLKNTPTTDGRYFARAFTESTWKVWNVQRYDKLNLVKSSLLTHGRRDLICGPTYDAAASKMSCSTARAISRAAARFRHRNTFHPGHFAIIRLPTAGQLIRALEYRTGEKFTFHVPLSAELTDFRSYYCYPEYNRTVKPLATQTPDDFDYARVCPRAHTYGLHFTADVYQPLD